MAKLTRKSYKRKKIAFGAAILGGIALVSSGFAAFVLSANANKDAEGAVNVGKVINGSVAMELYYQNGSNYVLITDENKTNTGAFSFDAPESDVKKEGEVNRVYYKKIGDTKPETLSLAYKCSIESKTDSLASLNVKMTTVTSAGNDLNQAVTDGYVTLPSCLSNKGITATFTEGKETFTSDLGTGSNDNITIKKRPRVERIPTINGKSSIPFLFSGGRALRRRTLLFSLIVTTNPTSTKTERIRLPGKKFHFKPSIRI